MPVISPPASPSLSTPPSTASPANFDSRADIFLGELPPFQLSMVALAANVFANATDAATSATTASAAAVSAAASAAGATSSANVAPWNAATNYSIGVNVFSPITFFTYRRRVAGVSATDPSADPANWALQTVSGRPVQNVAITTVNAFSGVHYALDNAATTTVTAPATATPGDSFRITSTTALTTHIINWNGLKHEGISDATMVMDVLKSYEPIYISAAFGWKVL